MARASLPRSRLNCILPERRERERESLRKSPREVLREPTMDPLYCYAVAARMPPSRPLSRYADTRASSSSSFVPFARFPPNLLALPWLLHSSMHTF